MATSKDFIMKNNIAAILNSSITTLLLVVAGLTPLLFLNQTTEFFEMPKMVFLLVSTVVLLGLWIASWIVKGKVEITRTPLDIPLLVLLAIVLLSTYFSDTRYSAIYGNFPRVHGSAAAWATYIALYFVTVSNLKNLSQIKAFMYVLYGSGVAVALISLLSYFNLFLPFNFARAVNFTPTGSTFSTVAFLAMLLPLPLISLLKNNKYLPMPVAMALSIVFGVTLALLGSIPAYIVVASTFALCFLAARPRKVDLFRKALPMFLIPAAVTVLVGVIAFLPVSGNKIQQLQASFPKEIQLPFEISWKVSATAFRDAPYIGTGPSSYLFNFTTYKPLEFNSLPFWNFSFDTAHNEFLQVLGTLGILGLLSLLIISLVVLNSVRKNLFSSAHDDAPDTAGILLPALAVSGLTSIALMAIHATTLVSAVSTILVFALLMVAQKSIRSKVVHLSMGLKASTLDNKQFDLLPVIVFVVFLAGAVPLLYQTSKAVRADYYHRQALLQANVSGNKTYEYLQKAETLNPVIDLYRIDLAQTNFALANAIAIQKGPTEANPKGSLTDQDRRTIQTLISQAINEGRVSVALSPLSARNWEVLASVYRNISGIAQNALSFSLDAYGRAIQRDPLNPSLRISVGGIYYTAQNYDLAIRFFTDAANLKPDNANAYYNLAIALREKGDLQNAKLVADQAVNLLSKNKTTQDYKIAVGLSEELKQKIAETPTDEAATATADKSNSALTPDTGVSVNDLNNPPQASTPSAVKANPNANLPKISPTPTR